MPNQTTNRRKVLKALGAGGIAGLAGCSGGGGGGQQTPTETSGGGGGKTTTTKGKWPDLSGEEVHFLTESSQDAAQKYFKEVKKDFEEKTGATLNVEYVGIGGTSAQRISQLIQGGNPPEVFMANGGDTASFANQGVAEPVTDVLKDLESVTGKPDPGARIQIGGEDYMVPTWLNMGNYYFRGDLVDKYNGDNPPETWADMREFAKLVSENTDKNGCFIPAISDPNLQSFQLFSWFFPTGEDFMARKNDKIVVNYDSGSSRKALIKTLNHLKELHQYSPTASDASYTQWSNAIPNGTTGTAQYPGFRPITKSYRREKSFADQVFNTKGVPSPDGSKGVSVTSTEGLVTFKQANTKAAKTFMRYIMQPEVIMDIYFVTSAVHNTPAYPDIRSGDMYKSRLKELPIPMDRIKNYQNPDELITKTNDISPPNPYVGASYQAPAIADIVVNVLLKDEDPGAMIDQYAPQHQKRIDRAQKG